MNFAILYPEARCTTGIITGNALTPWPISSVTTSPVPISLRFVRSLALVRQSASCEYRPHAGAFQPQFPRRVAGQQPLSQMPSLTISRRSVRTPSLSNGVMPALSADADVLQ